MQHELLRQARLSRNSALHAERLGTTDRSTNPRDRWSPKHQPPASNSFTVGYCDMKSTGTTGTSQWRMRHSARPLLIVENDIYKCTVNLQSTPAAIVDEA